MFLILGGLSEAAPFAYVTNSASNNVSVIDMATNTVTATVNVGKLPFAVDSSPDGKKVYVVNYLSNNVSVIDTATNKVIDTVNVGSLPFGIAVNPQMARAYVANYLNNSVSIICTVSDAVIGTVGVGEGPWGIAVNPNGTRVYVANLNSNTTSVIDTSTNSVVATVKVGNNPWGVAVSPDGNNVFVTNSNSNSVSIINATTNTVTTIVKVGFSPWEVAVSPDGKKAYVTNSDSNNASEIDTLTNNVTATVNVGNLPCGVTFNPEGSKAYVVNSDSNNVSVIDTGTNTIIDTVNVGRLPVAIGKFVDSQSPSSPVANFSSNVNQGSAPLTVQFTDQSKNASVWNWNFGDGTNSTQQNPTHTYIAVGNYTVTLTVNNSAGSNTTAKPNYIIVSNNQNALAADFSASPTSGKVPFAVSFTDKSSGSPTTWKWTFGDGGTSTVKNPVHSYNKTGLYSVTLTVSKTGSSNSVTKSSYIAISSGFEAPVAAFLVTPTSGKVPLTISFTDKSSGSPTSWKWTFGDGNTSTDKNPVHTYNKTGQFTVVLTASNANGSNTVTKTSYITVSNNLNAPIANFSASSYSGKVPLTVSFTDKSSGTITSRKWTFGDGNNSTQQNPIYTYSKTGKFNVALTTTNAEGSDTVTKYSCINVTTSGTVVPNPVRLIPVTAFSATPTSGSVPLTVSFADQSTGSPTSWRWSFGDGGTSTNKSSIHVYNKTGQFSVTLTASNANGTNSLTKTSYIVVSSGLNVPVTNFSASPTSGSVPLTVSFTDKSSGPVSSWKWTFGDWNYSTVQNPVYKYNKAGLYSVTLTTTNAGGSGALTKTSYIAVSNSSKNPVAAFSAFPVSGNVPLTVSFTDKSLGSPTSWKWSFGDGNTSTVQNPVYKYNKTGLFTVGLTITNPGGSSTETMTGYITVK